MEKSKTLSLVIPAYKQEKTIVRNITSLQKTLKYLRMKKEIVVVIDGNPEKTKAVLKKAKIRGIKIFSYEHNQGKGFAVRYGMLKAKGDIIGFIDADMDIDPNGIEMLIQHMTWYNADIVIGSKLHPVSQVDYPFLRRILSWGYRSFIRVLFGLKIRDSQVGLKFYKRKVVRKVFPKILVKKFAFDIETLAVANAMGFRRIFEAPIELKFRNKSTISLSNFWKTIFWMAWDTCAVFYRLKIRHYYR